MDRAKLFYAEQAGFGLDVDHRAGEDFRVIHLTPRGSACGIALMKNPAVGSLPGLHLVVGNIEAARDELQAPGSDPDRSDDGSFLSFSEPDGNGWLVSRRSAASPTRVSLKG